MAVARFLWRLLVKSGGRAIRSETRACEAVIIAGALRAAVRGSRRTRPPAQRLIPARHQAGAESVDHLSYDAWMPPPIINLWQYRPEQDRPIYRSAASGHD